MQQTILALLALLIASFFTLSQAQSSLQSQKQALRGEIEQMALGIGMQSMEMVRARAFDSAVLGTGEDVILDPSNFSDIPNDLNYNCRLHASQNDGDVQDCQTIEEFNKTTGTVPFSITGGEIDFEVEIEVQYVCEDLEPCTGPTSRKKVDVYVQDASPDGQSSRLSEPIRYSEIFTYP
jgi:hypothetical protein